MAAILLLLAMLTMAVSMRVHMMRIVRSIEADTERVDQLELAVDSVKTAMLNQEVGLRGFLATGDAAFLEPYEDGRRDELALRKSLDPVLMPAEDRDELANALALEASVARRWHADVAERQIEARRRYSSIDVASFLVDGKDAFDDYRAAHGTLRYAVERAGLNAERRHHAELFRANFAAMRPLRRHRRARLLRVARVLAPHRASAGRALGTQPSAAPSPPTWCAGRACARSWCSPRRSRRCSARSTIARCATA